MSRLLLLAALLGLTAPSPALAQKQRKSARSTKVAPKQRAKAKVNASGKVARTRKTTLSAKLASGKSPLAAFRGTTAKSFPTKGLRTPKLVMKAAGKKQLKYLTAEISAKQVAVVEKAVQKIQAEFPGETILFRGQETLTKKVEAPVRQKMSLEKSIAEYDKAAAEQSAEAASEVAKVKNKPYPTRYEQGWAAHLEKSSGHELLAIKNQNSFSGKFFVSTTRSLSIAFGDFYMAPPVRYVYILSVPKGHAVNVHGLVADKVKTMKIPEPGNQREKELAIPLQATEFVKAVYDVKKNKVIPFKPGS